MRKTFLFATVITAALCSSIHAANLVAAKTSIQELEEQFRELPTECRRLTGPLFWLHGDESEGRLRDYVAKVAQGGNGSFTAESRPHSDWLGEGWYRDLSICLEEAKQHNLQMWIFDEKWWPSGEAGGMVPEKYASKRMTASATDVTGPARFEEPGYGPERLIAALAGRVTAEGIDGGTLTDLAGSIRDGVLRWDAPKGTWKVMKFVWQPDSRGSYQSRNYLVDGASRDSVDWYIQTVYQPHYDRFRDDFGTWIPGFFYDEPETRGDWGTEVFGVLKERGVDWKKALVAYKFALAGEEQTAARYQYLDAFAEAWGRTLFGGITKWCHDHKVLSIGHFLEHRYEYLHPELCAGNMFQLQKYSDFGGIDAVFDQFVMGKRVARDAPTWQTPKLGSSISHVYGKADDITMVEIFGARGQNLTYPEMKWWTDHMHVSGVNFHIPHSFNPRSPYDTDCPPYFYNGGYEPRWPLYRVYADYTSRLSLMLSGGRHVCPVALLFLGDSRHVGKSVTPEQISAALQDALYDCDWMPYEVFENDVRLDGRDMGLYQERYRILVVPPVEAIPYATLLKARQFFDQGGIVVAHGFLPSQSTTLGHGSQEIAGLCDAIWGRPSPGLSVCKTNSRGGRSYLLPEEPTPEQLQQVLAQDAGIHPTLEVLEGDTGHWLHVLHRVKAGRDVFFLCNQNVDGGARRYRFRITAEGWPECWDAMRNELTAIPFVRKADAIELSLTLESNESTLIVFQPRLRNRPTRIGPDVSATKTIALTQIETPSQAARVPEVSDERQTLIKDCRWIWYPEANPASAASVGTVYFRKTFALPKDSKIVKARFVGTADNQMQLYVNGHEVKDAAASFGNWQQIGDVDITPHVTPGTNVVAIAVTNASSEPNPAGLIGTIAVECENGRTMFVPVDKSWKTTKQEQADWYKAAFDDGHWAAAVKFASYGEGPWGRISGRMLTTSPIEKANPYLGRANLSEPVDRKQTRAYLEMETIEPEAAVSVTINDQFIGGFVGKPYRIDVSEHLRAGANTFRIEPFAPKDVRLVFYRSEER